MTGFTHGRSVATAGPAFRLVLDLVGVAVAPLDGVPHCAEVCSLEGVGRERAPCVSNPACPTVADRGVRVRVERVFAGVVAWGMMLSRWV